MTPTPGPGARVEALRAAHGEITGHDVRSTHPDPGCALCTLLAHIDTLTTNEGLLLRQLSDLLTGGNAGTWEQIIHAATGTTTALREARAELAKHEKCIEENAAEFEKALEQTLDRAEHAEQRVAALEAALNKARDSLYWIKMHSHGEVHGDAMNAVDRIDTVLTPPPVAPSGGPAGA